MEAVGGDSHKLPSLVSSHRAKNPNYGMNEDGTQYTPSQTHEYSAKWYFGFLGMRGAHFQPNKQD